MTRISRLDARTVSATATYLFPNESMFHVANRMPPQVKERTVLVAVKRKNAPAPWSGPETPSLNVGWAPYYICINVYTITRM